MANATPSPPTSPAEATQPPAKKPSSWAAIVSCCSGIGIAGGTALTILAFVIGLTISSLNPVNLVKDYISGLGNLIAANGTILQIAAGEIGTFAPQGTAPAKYRDLVPGIFDPWCAFFMTWVVRRAGYNIPVMGHTATWYNRFKNGVDGWQLVTDPQPGDIAMKKNFLHITMVHHISGNTLCGLGGNQGNAVTINCRYNINDFYYGRIPPRQ